MIDGKRILGVICARGGSRELPGKNVRVLNGRPLIAWTIAAAAGSRLLDRTVVSSDDSEILDAARAWGGDVPFVRPHELAADDSNIVDAVLHAVDTLGEDYGFAVLLQATSPLRLPEDIDACIQKLSDSSAPAALTVAPSAKPVEWFMKIDERDRLEPVLRQDEIPAQRQAALQSFLPNGAVYAARVDWLRHTRSFWRFGETAAVVMPPQRSIDIDTLLDFRLAELLMR